MISKVNTNADSHNVKFQFRLALALFFMIVK